MNIGSTFTFVLGAVALSGMYLANACAAEVPQKCSECHTSLESVVKPPHPKVSTWAECLTCHDSKSTAGSLGQRIHPKHVEALGAGESACLSCHGLDAQSRITVSRKNDITFNRDEVAGLAQKYATWNNSGFLANSHKIKGVYCLACHEGFGPDDVDDMTKKCKACHGEYEELAGKTAQVKPRNPHKSHYAGLSCTKCHQVHAGFSDFCDKCHHTNFVWVKKVK